MLDKYDSYTVKVKSLLVALLAVGIWMEKVSVKTTVWCWQEYLVKEGNLSRGALRMIGDILNENSLFYTSLLEMLYIQSDINDNTEWETLVPPFHYDPTLSSNL